MRKAAFFVIFALLLVGLVSAVIPDPDSYYDFETDGTDSAGSVTADINGGAAAGSSGVCGYGNCMNTDAGSGAGNADLNDNYPFNNGGTIVLFYSENSSGSSGYLFGKDSDASGGFRVLQDFGTALGFGRDFGWTKCIANDVQLNASASFHIVITYNGNDYRSSADTKFFFNGTECSSYGTAGSSSPAIQSTTASFAIGSGSTGVGTYDSYAGGYYDEVAIFEGLFFNSTVVSEIWNSGNIKVWDGAAWVDSQGGGGADTVEFMVPTPADGNRTNYQVSIKWNSSTNYSDFYFGTTNPPTTRYFANVTNSSDPDTYSWLTNVTSDDIYYYYASLPNNKSINTSVRTWEYDTSAPQPNYGPLNLVSSVNVTYDEFNETWIVNMSVSDADLYGFMYNLTLSGTSYASHFNDSMGGATTYGVYDTIDMYGNPYGDYTFYVEAADSHTNNNIGDYKPKKVEDGINFSTSEGNQIMLISDDASEWASHKEVSDRYTIEVNFSDNKEKKRSFFLWSDAHLDYVGDTSGYLGHFVAYDLGSGSGNWIDFEGVNTTAEVFYLGNNIWQIDLAKTKDKIKFNSIGGLNVYSRTLSVTRTDAPGFDHPTPITSSVTTPATFNYDVNCSVSSGTIVYGENTSLFAINTASGVIAYTPSDAQKGVYDINITCAANGYTNYTNMELTVLDGRNPVISGYAASSISNSSATLSWNTDENANASILLYNASGLMNTSLLTTLTSSKSISYYFLEPNTTYYSNLTVWDSSGNYANNATYSFTTLSTAFTLDSVRINPTTPISSDSIAGYATATSNNNITFEWYWYKNGNPILNGSNTSAVSGVEILLNTLSSENTSLNDEIVWSVRALSANDSTAWQNVSATISSFNLDNCSNYTTQVLNFTFYEENARDSLEVDVVANFNITDGFDTQAFQVDATNITTFQVCVTPADTQMQLDAYLQHENPTGSIKERYYLTNLTVNSTSQDVFLYNFDDSTGISTLDAEVTTESFRSRQNVIVKMLRYYPELNSYLTVQMDKSDEFGQTVFYVYQDETDYRFLFEESNVQVHSTNPLKFLCGSATECEQSFSYADPSAADSYRGFSYSTSYTNSTGIYSLTWSDTNGLVSSVRLLAEQQTGALITTLCDTTTASSSGTIVCNLSSATGLVSVRAYRSASPEEAFVVEIIEKAATQLRNLIGVKTGGFVTFLFAGTVAMFGSFSLIGLIIMTVAAFIFTYLFGFWGAANLTMIVGATCVGAAVLFLTRNRGGGA